MTLPFTLTFSFLIEKLLITLKILYFLAAMRNKFRISKHLYQEFYKNLVRKKLSDFLLEEERRATVKAKRTLPKQSEASVQTVSSIVSSPALMSSISRPEPMESDEE